MLHAFLSQHRNELIRNCAGLVSARLSAHAIPFQDPECIAPFLDQVINTLRAEDSSQAQKSLDISGTGDGLPGSSEVGDAAVLNGSNAFRHGVAIEQVVHGYGDLCQAVTSMAYEKGQPIKAEEFRSLNRCLDNAIAAAVSEYSYQRGQAEEVRTVAELNEQLGMLAHELRNHVNTASLALMALKTGKVGIEGATGEILGRALQGLRSIIDRSLATVRINSGLAPRSQQIWLADFITEIASVAALEARARGCVLHVPAVDASLAMCGDREMLMSAVGNLLTNGFKFTRSGTEVSLRAYGSGDRILIEVADHCGGLRPGSVEQLFLPYQQNDLDRTGLGLGLPISRRSVEASGGVLTARDVPGTGCVFTIDLPRFSVA
jgi:signal transduction histidine kinase